MIKTDKADTISINGLQAGEYGIKYTLGKYNWRDVSPKQYNVDLESQNIDDAENISFYMPDQGVGTIYQVSDISAINHSTTGDDIIIYPNPTDNLINVKIENHQSIEYTLYDLFGIEKISGKINSDILKIDISQLAKGIYILKIQDKSYKVIKK